MPVIKPSCVRDVKLRVNIADVVAQVVTLRGSGSRLKGLCPFHNEKTPSFHVDSDKGFFKCFGCGKAGDVISFVRETEQLSFTEAVEALGQRYGVPIEYEAGTGPTREERSLRQEIFDIHEIATAYYHECLKGDTEEARQMRDYWVEGRRFSMEIADEFRIGFADANGGGLAAAVLKQKFSEEAIRQCGLFFVYDNTLLTIRSLRPRFRGRLMIPIRDHQGRVVAFTARQTALTPDGDSSHGAKYVNSPETPIFSKSHLLFNLDRARSNAGEDHPFVMVEGQLDAIRCWSVGLKTAIAPQGTAITEPQLQLLRRYHGQIDCFFDGDAPGQQAALRFLPLALKTGLEVRFLGAENAIKTDPDQIFREQGIDAYLRLRESARTAMQFACMCHLPDVSQASAEQKNRAAKAVMEIIRHADSAVIRSQFIEEAAGLLHLPLAAMQKDFAAQRPRRAPASASQDGAAGETAAMAPAPVQSPEQHLLMLILHYETLGRPISHLLLPLGWIDRSHVAGELLNRFLAEFEQQSWPGRDHLAHLLETDEERALVASLVFDDIRLDDPIKVACKGVEKLRDRALGPRLSQIELALAQASADSNSDPLSLIKERMEIQNLLRSPIDLGGLSA